MSEDRSGGIEAADRRILDLLDADPAKLANQEPPPAVPREYVELFGMLPRSLPGIAPGAAVRGKVLERIAREGSGDGSAPVPPAPPAEARARSGGRWLLPLAASLVTAMIAVTGWLVLEVRDQRALIAELSQQLEQSGALSEALVASRDELARVRSRLAMATTRGAEFCALSPPEGSPAGGARGVVVMHPAREEWFLRIEGLAPCPAGRKYIVWFATPGGRVPGPAFAATEGEAVEMTITDHPEEIRAIMITLEPEPAPEAPSTEPLLFGNERVQLL